MFVGREAEIRSYAEVLSDPSGEAILVVGHWGMGKTSLLDEFEAMSGTIPDLECLSLRYEIAKTDHVDETMSLILDQAIQAAQVSEGSLSDTPRRVQQWRAFLNCFGNLGDLIMSLKYDPKASIRDQFCERLHLVSDLMSSSQRLIIFIDPEKEMQEDSDQSWSIAVRNLPSKIKLVFAQRPEDVLATSRQFAALDNVLRIPEGCLGGLANEAVDELVNEYGAST